MPAYFSLVPLLLASGTFRTPPPARPVPLEVLAAVARRQVTITAQAQGLGAGNLTCTVRNLSGQPLRVRLPPGLHFAAGEDGCQDLLSCQELLLTLAPGSSARAQLRGFCLEQNDYAPSTRAAYTLRGLADQKLLSLADSLHKYPELAADYGQMFIWALTNGEPVRAVRVPTAGLSGAANVLRYLRATTGRATGDAHEGPAGQPSVKTFSKRVFVAYHSPVAQVASLRVYGADGHEQRMVAPRLALRPGLLRYQLAINAIVGAGTAPTYVVRLLNATGQVLHEQRVDEAMAEQAPPATTQAMTLAFKLSQPVKNAWLRVRLPDGTLVEDVRQLAHVPAGNHHFQWTFQHLRPSGTTFVARLETADGRLLRE